VIIVVENEKFLRKEDEHMDDFYLTEEDYAIAANNGISRKRAYQRFYQNGWEKERSITQPIVKGTLWEKFSEKCEVIGITKAAFYSRVYRGMSPEEASSYPSVPNGFSFKERMGKNET
jgi:hypothetical protein